MRYLSIFLCIRYLCGKKIVLLSTVAVAMACALLIAVASLFSSFIEAFEKSIGEHMGDIVITCPSSLKISKYDELIDRLKQQETIDSATAVLAGQGLLLLDKGDVRAVRIWGIQLPERNHVTPFAEALIRQKDSGSLPSFTLEDGLVNSGGFVGIGLLANPDEKTDEYDIEKIKKMIGRKVVLTTGMVIESDDDGDEKKFKRKRIKFNITDVVFSGLYEFDKNFVYLPIERLCEELYPDRGKVAEIIQIKLAEKASPQSALAVVGGIWRDFAKTKLNWSSYAISQTHIDTSKGMQARLITEFKKQMGMLMLIFGIVSGGVILLIFCIFYLIVITKQKDIAIIKSCGLSGQAVAVLFTAFGTIVGVIGSGVGVVSGYFVTKNANEIERGISVLFGINLWKSSTYMFSRIPNSMNWQAVLWIVAAAIVAAGIGALIPAIVAARTKPVEILRYE